MVKETNRNTITNKIVKESEKNQGVITKRDILDYKGYTILQSFYGKKMKNTLIEIKDDITRNFIPFFTNETMLFMDMPIYGMIEFYIINSSLLDSTKVNKEVGKIEIDNIRNDFIQTLKDTGIAKSYSDKYWMYEKDYFEGDYVVEIFKNLEQMSQLNKIIIIVENSNMVLISDGELSSGLIKATDKCSGEFYETGNFNCSINTAISTQNNQTSKDELKSIIDLIEKDLKKLNQEDAEDLQDTLSMVVEEFNNGTPRVGRLRKYITLLAPMMTVTNGIPVLADNMQKLYNYIMSFIN